MKRAWLGWLAITGVAVAAVVGCAVGDSEGLGADSQLTNLPDEAGDEHTGAVLPPPVANDDAGGDASRGDAGHSDASTDGGTDAGSTALCVSPNTCAAATDLGQINADDGSDTMTASGTGSQWFKIRMHEDDNSAFGALMQMRATVTSPPGTSFNVFLYRASGTNGQECTTTSSNGTISGATAVASDHWGEGGFLSNGSDDSREVTVEVRHISGNCSAAVKWTLTVNGDTE